MEIEISDKVRNIVGKGEVACYEQFLLFPQCFQKLFLNRQNEYLWSKGLKTDLDCVSTQKQDSTLKFTF